MGELTVQLPKDNVVGIILYNRALTNADRKTTENYLGDKWGININ